MDDRIFQKALHLAQLAAKHDEVPVGAIIFHSQTGEIIAEAFNHVESRHDPTAHAEISAIQKAGRKLGVSKLVGYSIFVSLEPCAMCAMAIALARLDALYFGAFDPKTGGVCQGAKIFTLPQTHHKPHVQGGFYATECGALLKDFFKQKRGQK